MERLLKPKDALQIAGISASTAKRRTDFPKPIVLSRKANGTPARIAYVASEIEAWVQAQIAADRGKGGG